MYLNLDSAGKYYGENRRQPGPGYGVTRFKARKHLGNQCSHMAKPANGELKIAHNRQNWNGFDLVRGHVYGIVDGVMIVSGGQPASEGHITVYGRVQRSKDTYEWVEGEIWVCSPLAEQILTALSESPYHGVQFPEYLDCRGSKPHFPTFRDRRAEHKPMPPAPRPHNTWVDRICAGARK